MLVRDMRDRLRERGSVWPVLAALAMSCLVGGAFGAAIATAILTSHLIEGSRLPTEAAYTTAFVVSAVAGVLAVGAALLVPRTAPVRA